MENSLKQRIIGAIVLVALAIIFLPSILKEKTTNGNFESKIPEKPRAIKDYKMDTFKIDELLVKEDIKAKVIQNKAKAVKIQIDEIADQPIIDEKPAVSEGEKLSATPVNSNQQQKVGGSWIIQVASFSKHDNAIKLVNKLINNGHKAYKNKVIIDKSIVYRVFVGPFIKKEKARNDVINVDKVSGTKGMLKIFNPIKH